MTTFRFLEGFRPCLFARYWAFKHVEMRTEESIVSSGFLKETTMAKPTSLQLFKLTPRTNCGKCGFPTCLAFATQVMVGNGNLGDCPHLDPKALAPFYAQLAEHPKTESFEKTFDFSRREVAKWDFRSISDSLGATLEASGELLLNYFGNKVRISGDDILSDHELDPWEKILLYNYVIGGAVEPSGNWVGMESLPNSVSKIKSLKTHCEEPLAQAFAGKMTQLGSVGLGHILCDAKADFGADFQILPKLTVRVLWWDEDPEERFEAKVKFLFDARVLQVVDLESLIFACEQLTNRLLEAHS